MKSKEFKISLCRPLPKHSRKYLILLCSSRTVCVPICFVFISLRYSHYFFVLCSSSVSYALCSNNLCCSVLIQHCCAIGSNRCHCFVLIQLWICCVTVLVALIRNVSIPISWKYDSMGPHMRHCQVSTN